jgi:hypothetical protein
MDSLAFSPLETVQACKVAGSFETQSDIRASDNHCLAGEVVGRIDWCYEKLRVQYLSDEAHGLDPVKVSERQRLESRLQAWCT